MNLCPKCGGELEIVEDGLHTVVCEKCDYVKNIYSNFPEVDIPAVKQVLAQINKVLTLGLGKLAAKYDFVAEGNIRGVFAVKDNAVSAQPGNTSLMEAMAILDELTLLSINFEVKVNASKKSDDEKTRGFY